MRDLDWFFRVCRIVAIVAAILIFVAGLLAGWSIGARAHSFYPWECCSERDCHPVEARDVKSVPGGWQLSDGTFIGFKEARPSPDGKYHVCRHNDGKGALITLPEKPACFWAPIGAS